MNVLLLGGSGFISGAILRSLLELGGTVEVTALTRGTTDADWGRARHIACDRNDAVALTSAIDRRFDVVVDATCFTAAQAAALLDAVPEPPDRWVFISSAAVYDRTLGPLPFREDEALGGDAVWGSYGVDKLEAERLLHDALGSRLYVLRPPYVYGPGNNLEREDFIWARLLEGRPIHVPGEAGALVQFCHVDSISRFVADIVGGSDIAPGPYNVGDAGAHSFAEWIQLLAEVAGSGPPEIRSVTDPGISAREFFPFRDCDLVLDTSRWRAVPGHHAVDLREGLAGTLDWFRSQGSLTFRPVPLEARSP